MTKGKVARPWKVVVGQKVRFIATSEKWRPVQQAALNGADRFSFVIPSEPGFPATLHST